MTDSPSRREADKRLERIEGKLDEIPATVRAVIEGGEYSLPGGMSPRDLIADHAELHEVNGRIITALEGPEAQYTNGESYRLRELGITSRTQANGEAIERIETVLENGVKTRLPATIQVAIIGAAALIAAAAIPDIINRIPWP